MVTQTVLGQTGCRIILYPLHAARCQIRGRAQAGAIRQNLERKFGDLEGKGIAPFVPSTDGKYLASNFPDIGIAPLDHVGGVGQGGAKAVEFIPCHAP